MPKVKLSEWQEQSKILRANLEHLKGGKNNEEMGKIIAKSGVTFGSRMSNPGELRFREIYLLCKAYKIPISKFISEELKW